MPRKHVLHSLVLLVAIRSPDALASGLSIPDLGANALGQGAANVAAPEDLLAVYYNAGALALTPGLRVLVDLRRVAHDLSFQRLNAAGENPDGWARVANARPASFAPALVVGYGTERLGRRVAVALGGHPATGYSGYAFPDAFALRGTLEDDVAAQASPQRYALVSQDSLSYTFALALSAEVAPGASLGFTLTSPYVRLRSTQAVSSMKTAQPFEPLAWDTILRLDASDPFTLGGTLGGTLVLPWDLRAGASLTLPTTVVARGTLALEFGNVASGAGHAAQHGSDVELELKLPWIARAGVRLVKPAFELELAGTLDGWARNDEIVIRPQGIEIEADGERKPLAEIRSVKAMQNAVSARLGGLWRLSSVSDALAPLSLRAGALYETSAVPVERTSLDTAHWERLSLGAGLGAKVGTFDVALSYAHFFQPDRQVRTSVVRQSRSANPAGATVVGNGDYTSRIGVLGASLSAAID